MRIEGAKSVSPPLAEGPAIAVIGDRRVPRHLVSQREAHSPLPPLELGQEFEALILAELQDGRLLLRLGATAIEADSPGGLRAGQYVRLRVAQLQPQVVLHVTDADASVAAEAARLLRHHLPAHTNSGELLDSLQDKLTALLQTTSVTASLAEKLTRLREFIAGLVAGGALLTPERLEILLRDGGIFYEAKLFDAAANSGGQLLEIADHDLKGLLLLALQETKAHAFSTGLQNALSAQLDNLETQQAINLLAQLAGGAFQLQIPFFTGTGFSTAALAVEPDGDSREGESDRRKSGYSLLFILDLENFGRTRIDAHIKEKELRAVFFVDSEPSVEMIRQELPDFRETLRALGYTDIVLAAKPLRDLPPQKQQKFAALANGAPSSIQLLDTKA